VIFPFIERHKGAWPVAVMCDTLGVSPAGFYAWLRRPRSEQRQRRDALVVEIRAAHAEAKARYGNPRIHAELRANGVPCCANTVARLMRDNGVRAKTARKFRNTTDSNHKLPVADNLLDRQFEAQGPNERWLADITYIPTREGWLYLAAVEDLYSRMVVGWSMADTMTSRLVVDALQMAVARRLPGEGLLAHSDRGSQYASDHYQRLLGRHGIECSMSGVGQCWDNAPMESFFASLKKELVHDEDYQSRAEARVSIFEYIEAFYNPKRLHSSLGYLSPAQYEQAQGQDSGEAGQVEPQAGGPNGPGAFFRHQLPAQAAAGVGGERTRQQPARPAKEARRENGQVAPEPVRTTTQYIPINT
jgi:putative transposase